MIVASLIIEHTVNFALSGNSHGPCNLYGRIVLQQIFYKSLIGNFCFGQYFTHNLASRLIHKNVEMKFLASMEILVHPFSLVFFLGKPIFSNTEIKNEAKIYNIK